MVRKNTLTQEQQERTKSYIQSLHQNLENHIEAATQEHREQMRRFEEKFLTDRHTLIADKEDALVAMEQRQLHTKHQTVKEQMKEQYRLQRTQLQKRLSAEIDHLNRSHEKAANDLEHRCRQEKKRQPAHQKQDARARLSMFKQKLRIESVGPSEFKNKVKKFQSDEIVRMSREKSELVLKHEKVKRKLEDDHKFDLDEMQQHHIEKKKMLAQREQERIKALDEAFARDFATWQQQVPMRKMLLEKKFEKQKSDQMEFFSKHELHRQNTLRKPSAMSTSNENLTMRPGNGGVSIMG